jgi:L,D-transpeptidase catalytic domain
MTKIRSTAIAIPLVIVSLMMANPANGEQIGRASKSIDDDTPVTELNLAIPGERSTSNSSQKSSPKDYIAPKTSSNKQSKKVESKSRRDSTIATKIEPSTAVSPNTRSTSKRKLATNSLPPLSGNYLRLVRDPNKGSNSLGNPIYTLEAYVDGRKYKSFKAVSGTATTQNRDRDIANTFAPLPDGMYRVNNGISTSNIPEVGKTFIAIYPQFETDRSDLGIHQDPSYNKRNGHDGTAGCIGLTSEADRDAVNSFVTKYQPRNLIVKIDTEI